MGIMCWKENLILSQTDAIKENYSKRITRNTSIDFMPNQNWLNTSLSKRKGQEVKLELLKNIMMKIVLCVIIIVRKILY